MNHVVNIGLLITGIIFMVAPPLGAIILIIAAVSEMRRRSKVAHVRGIIRTRAEEAAELDRIRTYRSFG